ncbi:hypothetical protein N7448_011031 [Penicillium atrosanguineum]|nr:hypothetical protein N7448_011031 [Penicillium atrosanguineum]
MQKTIRREMAEEISLFTSTIQHQLPSTPSAARKSQKQIVRFGALTTKDAKVLAAMRKTKCLREAHEWTPGLATEEVETAETPSRLPLEPV